MKQILYDYIHLTQMEFLLKHPIVVLATFFIIYATGVVLLHIQEKKKAKRKEQNEGELK